MVQTSLWQTYQWQGPCIFFQAILTQFWSTYVVLTNLTDKIIIIFVLTGGSNFSWTNISMTASLLVLSGHFDSIMIHLSCLTDGLNFFTHLLHVYWMNEGLTKRVQLFIWVHCMPKKESVVTQPFRTKNCPNCAPIQICDLHSSEGIQAIVRRSCAWRNQPFQVQYLWSVCK